MPSPAPIHSLYSEATRTAMLGFVVNLALGVAKLIGGIVGGSFALISDAVNSLGDVVTTVVVLVALRVAQRPPDEEHPYGHSRAEAIAGSYVALLMIVSALAIGWESLQRVHTGHGLPPVWTLWIAGSNVVIKECLYRFKLRVGQRTGSSALIANAWDHRSDAFCSLAVLIGLGIVRWGGAAWTGVDAIAALVVVVVILWTGSQLLRTSASELMDVQADTGFVQEIREAAAAVQDVRAVEKLRVRKSGLEFFADIHIEVDQDLTVAQGHLIGHRVKAQLMDQFSTLRDVLVHLEPHPHVHAQHCTISGQAPEDKH